MVGLKEIWKDKEAEADGGEDEEAGHGASRCLMQPLWQFVSVSLCCGSSSPALVSSLQHENPLPERRPLIYSMLADTLTFGLYRSWTDLPVQSGRHRCGAPVSSPATAEQCLITGEHSCFDHLKTKRSAAQPQAPNYCNILSRNKWREALMAWPFDGNNL